MPTAFHLILILHIISGFLALTSGFLSMLNSKGSKQHRSTGKIFFAAMTGVFVSATYLSLVKNIPFLFMVGFFSYYLACSGYRVLKLKKLHLSQPPAQIDWIISSIGILAGIGLIAYSIGWFTQRGAWGSVPLSFGLFCCYSGITDLKSFYKRPANKQHWLLTHGGRMAGAFAATLTAFTVVNMQIGPLTWTLWIIPGVIIFIWQRRMLKPYRKMEIKKGEVTTTA